MTAHGALHACQLLVLMLTQAYRASAQILVMLFVADQLQTDQDGSPFRMGLLLLTGGGLNSSRSETRGVVLSAPTASGSSVSSTYGIFSVATLALSSVTVSASYRPPALSNGLRGIQSASTGTLLHLVDGRPGGRHPP